MKITGTRGDIDVEYNGRTAQFDGELGMHGFYAIRNSMRWLPPYDHLTVTTKDQDEFVAAILNESKGKEFQVFFD